MQARVKWVEGLTFLGESASGHQILMDGNSGDKAPSPMEMVLMAAGGCSAIDVVSILQKGRHDVTDCEVKLTSERREEAPRLFTHINLHFVVTGKALKDAAVSRAVDLSAEKYCSVALMLEKAVKITHSYEVIEAKSFGWWRFADPPYKSMNPGPVSAAPPGRTTHAICFPSINRSTSGVMMSSIASPIFPPGTTNVFMCEINEPCSIASSQG